MSENSTKKLIAYLPRFGCIATGIVYSSIGVIAMLSFLKVRDGGADESSMLAVLNDFVIGEIFIWIILSGTVCYIVWRLYETVTDPYGYGNEWKGIVKRAGIALSTIADMLIVYAALQVIVGFGNIQENGRPTSERKMIENILHLNNGDLLVIAIGIIVFATAIIQLIYGITRGYRERADIKNFSIAIKRSIFVLGWFGYFARGVILGIIGFFFIKAGLKQEANYVVNTDKAFDFIGDHVGHVYFIIVAIGTFCYGLFMFSLGLTYDTDKD